LHPFVLFTSVWIGVLSLYMMRLSKLLIATDEQITYTIGLILIPYVLALGATALYFALTPKVRTRGIPFMCNEHEAKDLFILKRRLKKWLFVWMLLSIVEVIFSGGVPLFWLLTGSSKSYVNFGIPSLHGLLNSMILSLGLCYTGMFAKYGERRYLLCAAGIIVWSVLLVTRSMIIVNLIQAGLVTILYRGISGKLALKLVAAVLLIVIGFGVLGDARSGATYFRDLAQPSEKYPEWLPSGALWVYIYLTTPLNNLVNSMSAVHPVNSLLFPNTAAPLFPTVIRQLIYGESLSSAVSGELVNPAFNVSTAYVGPFQDYGSMGIVCFSLSVSILAVFYWRRSNIRDHLIYIVIGQCLLLTVFYNHFFSLPVITQIAWIYLFFRRPAKHESHG
jgi:oligosaccharide repeat unit polymerase